MARKRYLVVLIGFVSILVGIALAFTTKGDEVSSQPFATMATVQGAFVGIVFSIFVLASHVSAAQFTPLTLEQLSKSRSFAGLLVFYVIAIMVNVYLVHTLSLPISPKLAQTDWNYAFGLSSALTTASLLSLLIARQLLADLTSPETLLKRTAKSASRNSYISPPKDKKHQPTPPNRTPLFTIEQILTTANENGDEYTVELSIYHLYKSISELLFRPTSILNTILPNRQEQSQLDVHKLLSHWSTAVEIGKSGPEQRIRLVATAHRMIVIDIIKIDEVSIALDLLEDFQDIFIAAKNDGDSATVSSILSEYDLLVEFVADNDSESFLTMIITHHAELVHDLVQSLDSDDELDEEAVVDLISSTLMNYPSFLGHIWESDSPKESARTNTNWVIGQIDRDLTRVFEAFDGINNTIPRKQNLLSELHQNIAAAASSIDPKYSQPTNRYLIMVAEISLSLGYSPETTVDSIEASLVGSSRDNQFLTNHLEEWDEANYSGPEIEILEQSGEDVTEYLSKVASSISKNN